jgi:hypothetical protein
MKLGGARIDVTWETTKSAELVWLSVRSLCVRAKSQEPEPVSWPVMDTE